MAKWKLSSQTNSERVYELFEGDEVTVGRGIDNRISLSSIVISRHHCLLNVKKDEVSITDLKSSNGIYIGLKRIPPNIPHSVSDNDIIGFGWTFGTPQNNVSEQEKYVFKLTKCTTPIKNRIKFQDDFEDDTDTKTSITIVDLTSHNVSSKLRLKRKLTCTSKQIERITHSDDVINISDNEDTNIDDKSTIKKIKLDPTEEDVIENEKKTDNEDIQFEAFNIKQEYFGYDEPIEINSDSDSESELFVRLSQSSPIKPFSCHERIEKKTEAYLENSSYSQLDDIVFDHNKENNIEEDFIDDIIYIPQEPKNEIDASIQANSIIFEKPNNIVDVELSDDIIIEETVAAIVEQKPTETIKMAQMIEPLIKQIKTKCHTPSKSKSKSSKCTRSKSHSSSPSKTSITNSLKEERKKRLKELASKVKEDNEVSDTKILNTLNKVVPNVKVTTSNRGAFLIDVIKTTNKPMSKKNNTEKDKNKSSESKYKKCIQTSKSSENKDKNKQQKDDIKQNKTIKNNMKKTNKEKEAQNEVKEKAHSSSHKSSKSKKTSSQISLKNLKPLTDSEELMAGKPVSKVLPLLSKKLKKQVRFSNAEPIIHEFEIEPGNMMRRTSSVRTRLVDARNLPRFSLEKITLMKILRWNPQWLDEQTKNMEPPPILGHNHLPMVLFHNFTSHQQYSGLVGDLLLLEIWECITQAYMRIRHQNNVLQLRIESLPPVPPQERYFDLCNLSVNISLLTSEVNKLPRVGEIMILDFGTVNSRNCRFFFVHNVRNLPSPPNNKNSFFSLALYATFTDKINALKPGEVIFGRTLAYINKEMMLFDAMEYLAESPLREAILYPKPHHFSAIGSMNPNDINIQSSKILNTNQNLAVRNSVCAALGDQPSIQMVQGPPGTGKSSVICAIVMTYFYMMRKLQNRGKILICASSNAAVDELVIRLLDIRQSLRKEERFRMVRVGRLEAMSQRARDVSSQQLAQRDAARAQDSVHPGVNEEISHLDAKINMWKTAEREAKDPVRMAYCRGRITHLVNRIALLRSSGGGGDGVRSDLLAAAERRIVDCADIIVTTLTSAHNHKMKALKGRISLCIVDEAGQAIEPEALIPLTLDITKLTLIGDPQQLPGFICSQRAKKHGLGESLFSRLTSCSEGWESAAAVLLNQQYRMHPAIADYPNRAFYGGRVCSLATTIELDLPPYTIVGICSGDKGQGPSYANETEACGVARLAVALASKLRATSLTLAVITPYSAQRDLLRSCLRELRDPCSGAVEVNTVDSFQGQERDVVVVSLARSHGVGFLMDTGRMNVMLTRAKHALFVCLNPHAVIKNNQWQTLIDDAQERKLYVTLPNRMCEPVSARSVSCEEVLKHIKTHR